jgi:predicted Zn-dependent protease
MFRNHVRFLGLCLMVGAILVSCATSPTGRSQVILMSAAEMSEMGSAAFAAMQTSTPRSANSSQTGLVNCVADSIVAALTSHETRNVVIKGWEVELFDDPTANAFALPGGKMGVHTGLLNVAESPSQLAAVMGHEVAHVLARHGNERVSQSTLSQSAMQVVQSAAGVMTPEKEQLMGMLGVGLQYGILMPFGRGQESEADVMGLELMARAGFDPRESVVLWENMERASGGGAPPEFMSTHPSNRTRIAGLQKAMPNAIALYDKAVAEGNRATCR